jgi:hypothetical protein
VRENKIRRENKIKSNQKFAFIESTNQVIMSEAQLQDDACSFFK